MWYARDGCVSFSIVLVMEVMVNIHFGSLENMEMEVPMIQLDAQRKEFISGKLTKIFNIKHGEKIMIKNKLYIIGIFTVCFMLTGCGHEHTWIDATCTEPKICSECGETEGEALGHTWVDATCAEAKHCSVCGETEGGPLEHTWVDATCAEAKHCSVCGETEGEPLGHTLTEANYQQPATCEVCGETVGEVLPPAFEEHGVKGQFMELGKTYDYVTCCHEDKNYKTTGHVTVMDYQTFTSDDTHEAKEGYEWKTVEIQIVFFDENARGYGYECFDRYEDYYDIIGFDDSLVFDGNSGKATFTVNFNGQDYSKCILSLGGSTTGWENDNTITLPWTYEYLVPTGYDGMVVGLYDSSIPVEDGMHIYDIANDDTLFFRLD